VQTTCSATGFQTVVTNVPANLLVRAVIRATPNALDALGGVNYTNVATITHVTSAGASTTDNVNGQRRSSRVGGDANGVNAPTTTVATTAPSTTEAPAVLPPLPSSTTTTAPSFASSPVLPATGSNHDTLLLVGVGLFLLGATMSVAARREQVRRP
jgi:LPXTG-motif cell wall-anchored protein